MKLLGHSLLVLGTIVGTLGGAHLPEVSWAIAGIGLGILLVGVVLIRVGARHRAASAPGATEADPLVALRRLHERLSQLLEDFGDIGLDELTARLSRLEGELMEPIAEKSPGLLGRFGAAQFADIFGAYASGERALARAWSAAADRHREEARVSLERAAEALGQAVDALDRASSRVEDERSATSG